MDDHRWDYYLGHFLFEQDATNLAANTLLIIDGQQRLTTCIIFFSALHRTLEERKKAGESVTVDTDDIVHNYGNKFHHDTNAAWETESINDNELVDFCSRTLNFAKRT